MVRGQRAHRKRRDNGKQRERERKGLPSRLLIRRRNQTVRKLMSLRNAYWSQRKGSRGMRHVHWCKDERSRSHSHSGSLLDQGQRASRAP